MLWFLFIHRVNLSPFTKDYRGEEQSNELDSIFGTPSNGGVIKLRKEFGKMVGGTFLSGSCRSYAVEGEIDLISSYHHFLLELNERDTSLARY